MLFDGFWLKFDWQTAFSDTLEFYEVDRKNEDNVVFYSLGDFLHHFVDQSWRSSKVFATTASATDKSKKKFLNQNWKKSSVVESFAHSWNHLLLCKERKMAWIQYQPSKSCYSVLYNSFLHEWRRYKILLPTSVQIQSVFPTQTQRNTGSLQCQPNNNCETFYTLHNVDKLYTKNFYDYSANYNI